MAEKDEVEPKMLKIFVTPPDKNICRDGIISVENGIPNQKIEVYLPDPRHRREGFDVMVWTMAEIIINANGRAMVPFPKYKPPFSENSDEKSN